MLLLVGAALILICFILAFGFYIFSCYVMSRIGDKFLIGSFWQFLIPVYNVMLLCDCAAVTRWTAVGIVLPGLVSSFLIYFSFGLVGFRYLTALVFAACWVYMWGNIAKRLGKDFWLWGVICLFGLPILILAFGNSLPKRP